MLQGGGEVVGDGRSHMILSTARQFDHHIADIVNGVGIITTSSGHGVGSGTTVEPIDGRSTVYLIISGSSINQLLLSPRRLHGNKIIAITCVNCMSFIPEPLNIVTGGQPKSSSGLK